MIQNSQVAALAARVQQYSAEPRKQFVAPSAKPHATPPTWTPGAPGWRPWAALPGRGARTHLRLAAPDRVGPRRQQHRRRRDRRAVPARGAEPGRAAVVQLAAAFRPSRPRSRATPTRAGHHAQLALRQRHPGNPSPMTEARYAVIGNPIAHSRSQIHAMFARQTGRALRYDRLLAPLDGFVAATTAFVAEGGGWPERDGALQAGGLRAGGGQPVRPRQAGRRRQHAVLAQRRLARLQHRRRGPGVGPAAPGPAPGRRPRAAGRRGRRGCGVLQPLAQAGCARIHIVNRTAARALELAEAWRASGAGLPVQVTAGTLAEAATPGGWDAVINATASGLADAAPTCPAACMPPARWPTT